MKRIDYNLKQELCIVVLLTVHLSVIQFQGASSLSEQLDINFMRKGANNQAHYPDAVGNVVSGPQWTLHNSPQMFGWSMPPGNGHYDCNTGVLSTAWNMNDPGLHSASFYRESGEPC